MLHNTHTWLHKICLNRWAHLVLKCHLHVQSARIEFFFKSTSSHVVNIEVFECTAKDHSNVAPSAHAFQSPNDFLFKYRVPGGAVRDADPTDLGTVSRHFTQLHQNYTVKTHRVKLNPGAHSSLSFSCAYNKTFDGSQMQENATTFTFTKGSKTFWFRVLNDPTVSHHSGVGNIGIIHSWPSNQNGGVAVRYKKTYRITPPKVDYNSGFQIDTRNTVKIWGGISQDADTTDQQVTVNNPPDTGAEE